MTTLVVEPDTFRRATQAAARGHLDGELAAEAHAQGWTDGLLLATLQVVATPVLRVSVEGRYADAVELVQTWSCEERSVVAAPLEDGRQEVVVGHTSHLPLQLAAALGLSPRPRSHGVDGPLRLPATYLARLLEGDAAEPPRQLPANWRAVLLAWNSPVRWLQVTSGGLDATGEERWRSFAAIDDLERGPFLVQRGEQPTERVILPTDTTTIFRLLTRALQVPAA
jgi:hypothetical protein